MNNFEVSEKDQKALIALQPAPSLPTGPEPNRVRGRQAVLSVGKAGKCSQLQSLQMATTLL